MIISEVYMILGNLELWLSFKKLKQQQGGLVGTARQDGWDSDLQPL